MDLADSLAELGLSPVIDSAQPPSRRPVWYCVALVVGLAITVALAALILLVVIPSIAKFIATLLQIAPRLVNGM